MKIKPTDHMKKTPNDDRWARKKNAICKVYTSLVDNSALLPNSWRKNATILVGARIDNAEACFNNCFWPELHRLKNNSDV